MTVSLTIPLWVPVAMAVLAAISLGASLIDVQETYRRGEAQTASLAAAGLSAAYLLLNLDLAGTILTGGESADAFSVWVWLAAHAISLVLVYLQTHDRVLSALRFMRGRTQQQR